MVVWIVYTGVPPVATYPVDLIVAVHFLCWIRPAVWSAPSAVVVIVVLFANRSTRSFVRLTLDTGHFIAFATRIALVVLQDFSFVLLRVDLPDRSLATVLCESL
jgi:hypothetical protein